MVVVAPAPAARGGPEASTGERGIPTTRIERQLGGRGGRPAGRGRSEARYAIVPCRPASSQ
jgi:hypothetical protein